MKHQSYLNRALVAKDRRFARLFGKLGYDTGAMQTDPGVQLVFIPENWRELSWPAMKSLAADISDKKINSKDDAVAAIELELQQRVGSN